MTFHRHNSPPPPDTFSIYIIEAGSIIQAMIEAIKSLIGAKDHFPAIEKTATIILLVALKKSTACQLGSGST